MTRKMNIGVIGFGSIGQTIADLYHELGYNVLANDINEGLVKRSNHEYIEKQAMGDEGDIIFIVVPTPTSNGGTDISIIESVFDDIHSTEGTVVIRSTVPPGTTTKMSRKYDLPIVHMPEMLRDTWGVEEALNPDRLVFGGPPAERKKVVGIHADLDTTFLEYDDPTVAELGKYAHNAFFATKVSFANQMKMYAEEMDIDPSHVMEIVTADYRNTEYHMDPFMGPFGGKCLPKDLASLMYVGDDYSIPHPLFDGVYDVNVLTKEEMGPHTPSQEILEFDIDIYNREEEV